MEQKICRAKDDDEEATEWHELGQKKWECEFGQKASTPPLNRIVEYRIRQHYHTVKKKLSQEWKTL